MMKPCSVGERKFNIKIKNNLVLNFRWKNVFPFLFTSPHPLASDNRKYVWGCNKNGKEIFAIRTWQVVKFCKTIDTYNLKVLPPF